VELSRAVTAAQAKTALPLAACSQLVLAVLFPGELTPARMLACAALVLAGLALAFVAHAARIGAADTARPLTGRASALREKSRAAVFQRLLNPDEPGRSRPRAPSAAPAAAQTCNHIR
jgi:hypothetical protein